MLKKRTAVVLGAAVLALSAAATSTVAASGQLPLLNRSAKGNVDEYGGAARVRGDQSQLIKDSIKSSGARNVILFIGDGMGDSEITVARNYLEGAGGFFKGIDALPLTGQMTHYSVNKDTGKPDYVPDSAATGTAWATGVKTYDNAVSVDRHGKAFPTLLELAKKNGLATGDVTTSEIQDATPAVQVSHISARSCYGPVATTANCTRAPRRTAAAARSASSSSTPVPTSPSAVARRPSPRSPRPGSGPARRWSSRPRTAATTTSPTRTRCPECPTPTRRSRSSACSPRATCR